MGLSDTLMQPYTVWSQRESGSQPLGGTSFPKTCPLWVLGQGTASWMQPWLQALLPQGARRCSEHRIYPKVLCLVSASWHRRVVALPMAVLLVPSSSGVRTCPLPCHLSLHRNSAGGGLELVWSQFFL